MSTMVDVVCGICGVHHVHCAWPWALSKIMATWQMIWQDSPKKKGLWRKTWDLLLSLRLKASYDAEWHRACNQPKYPGEQFAASQSIRTWPLGRMRWMPCPSRASFLFLPEAALKFKAKISHRVEATAHPRQNSARKLLAKFFPHRQEPHAQHQVFFSGAQTFSLQSSPIFECSRCESNMVQLTMQTHVNCKLQ